MLSYRDQTGKQILVSAVPKRIISLVPSQSELLWDLGLREELVGITKFCIHPGQMFRKVERVGGTKQLDIEKIRKLKPDLIIGNKEENEKAQIEILQKEFSVWMSDIYNFEDVFEMTQVLGSMTGKLNEAEMLIQTLKKSLAQVKNMFQNKRVAYFIWNKPYMCAAKNTFIDAVLSHLGFENALAHLERYPEMEEETLSKLNPDICMLSSEPFPFKEGHIKKLHTLLPQAKIVLVDGEIFSWYGSRLLLLENYVKKILEPAFGEPEHDI